jgi:hypothetical protein
MCRCAVKGDVPVKRGGFFIIIFDERTRSTGTEARTILKTKIDQCPFEIDIVQNWHG